MTEAHRAAEAVDEDQLHDLKNRLTVVKGVAQLLDRQVQRGDWQREKIIARVDRLRDEIAQLEQLIACYQPEDGSVASDHRQNELR